MGLNQQRNGGEGTTARAGKSAKAAGGVFQIATTTGANTKGTATRLKVPNKES